MRHALLLALALFAVAIVGLLVLTPQPAATPTPPVTVPPNATSRAAPAQTPPDFRGVWAAQADDCRPGRETRLVIALDRMAFHESSGPILTVTQKGPRDVTFRVELIGEGQSRTVEHRFRLGEGGETLAALDPAESVILLRRRCPA